jgi:hypothetical protein
MKPKPRSPFFSAMLLGLVAPAVAFGVYLLTLSRTVAAEDTGELAASLYTLGVVHPTGYPLFTLLGWVFAHLPIDARVIWKLSLFGAVLCALATFVFFRLFLFLLSEKSAVLFRMKPLGPSGLGERAAFTAPIAAFSASLVFAFSRTYWTEAVSVEVYALHLVFMALVVWFFLRALSAIATGDPAGNRRWMVFAFTLGLSFTNHMMTVLLAPAFLVLYFQVHGFSKRGFIRIAQGIPLFALGLSLYLYLPLRAAHAPLMNWGDPRSLHAFWYHLSGGQYHGQMFSSFDIALRKLTQFTVDFPREFGFAPVLVAAWGIRSLFARSHRLLVFLLLFFFGCLFYSVNYAFDDPNFYLNTYLAMAIACAFGTHDLLSRVPEKRRKIAALACGALVLFPLGLNYRALDKSRDAAVEEYALNVLHSMDSGAVYFTNEYQRMAAPAFYLQIVEKVRPDIAVIDIVMLSNPWYLPHLKAMHPWLFRNSQPAFDAYMPELEKYVGGNPDTVAYNARVQELFLSILENSGTEHPVYASAGINLEVAPGYRRIPSGMVFRLAGEGDSVRFVAREPVFRPLPLPRDNPEVSPILIEYAESYANQGAYLVGMGDTATGVLYLQKALFIVPEFTEVQMLLRQYQPVPQ